MALTGAALAGSGAAYQGLFRNPLADPYTIGVASGAGLGRPHDQAGAFGNPSRRPRRLMEGLNHKERSEHKKALTSLSLCCLRSLRLMNSWESWPGCRQPRAGDDRTRPLLSRLPVALGVNYMSRTHKKRTN